MRAMMANLFCLGGIGMAGYGAWLVAPWLMFCAVGGGLSLFGVWLHRRPQPVATPEQGADKK